MTLPAPDDITDLFVELASAECTRHGERIDVTPNVTPRRH
jgi:hypothetical protein